MTNADSALPTTAMLEILDQTYPEAHCELEFANPFQLLIATILSAQCTDQKVNRVTSRLFAYYPNPVDIVRLGQAGLEEEIKQLGLFRTKAKNIITTCRILLDQFKGTVPVDRAHLEALPGVGRKTANVVLANAFGIPAIAVDTHVFRVAKRLGLAGGETVRQVEDQLMAHIPPMYWIKTHHLLIWHGRRICLARKPKCPICPLANLCPSVTG